MSSLWAFAGGAADQYLEKRKMDMAKKIREDEMRLREELNLAAEQRQDERRNDENMIRAESERLDRERKAEERKEDRDFDLKKLEADQKQSAAQLAVSQGYLANAQEQTRNSSLADAMRYGPVPGMEGYGVVRGRSSQPQGSAPKQPSLSERIKLSEKINELSDEKTKKAAQLAFARNDYEAVFAILQGYSPEAEPTQGSYR